MTAAGVPDHAAFVAAVQEATASSNWSDSALSKSDSKYVGGESRTVAGTHNAHVTLAVSTGSTSNTPMAHVFRSYLDNALPQKFPGEAFAAEGIVGVRGFCPAGDAGSFVDNVCGILESMGKGGDKEISNALIGARADAEFDVLDSAVGAATAGFEVDDFKKIQKGDVTKAVGEAFKRGVSIASVGDVGSVPYHADVKGRF